MTDPLSLAASVAGLLSLARTVSKSAFQFITSILDAAEQARSLVSALYSLNVALVQVQGSLLDPKFVLQVDDRENIRMLQECLTSCTAVFLELKNKVEDSGLEESGSSGLQIRWRWEQVKWSFTDDETAGLLRRIESEKSTLGLVLNVFTAYVLKSTTCNADLRSTESLAPESSPASRKQKLEVVRWTVDSRIFTFVSSGSSRRLHSKRKLWRTNRAHIPSSMRTVKLNLLPLMPLRLIRLAIWQIF
ncbi:hypothetical protein K440DRAFT_115870 [Wilcoxina mikolae CBS 423.85]|nr:hypothetical protein K440DRAFT_115870 [Wilcoxina mikolae CBS 423.85]